MPCEKGEDEPEPGYVTFSQFCVTRHEGQKYSFSKWVCEAMDLIVQCLCQANDHPLWKDGYVNMLSKVLISLEKNFQRESTKFGSSRQCINMVDPV